MPASSHTYRALVALATLDRLGIPLGADFHALSMDTAEALADEARKARYRPRVDANGSTARCFHSLLQRRAAEHRPAQEATAFPERCPYCNGFVCLEVHPPSHHYTLNDLRDQDGCPVDDPDCLGDAGDCHDACEPGIGFEWARCETDPEPAARVYCGTCMDLERDKELCARILSKLRAPTWEPSRL